MRTFAGVSSVTVAERIRMSSTDGIPITGIRNSRAHDFVKFYLRQKL